MLNINQKSFLIFLTISIIFCEGTFKFSLPDSQNWPKLEDFTNFKNSLSGKVFLRGEAGYNPHTHNTRINIPKPAVILKPTSKDDILKTLEFAKKFYMRISIQSTGQHQDVRNIYDNSVHIDMSNMKGKTIDVVNKKITVETGNTFGELHEYVKKESGEALMILSGSDSGVGPYGWTAGGGHGKFTRLYGLGVDNLLSMELLTYDGTVLNIDNQTNPELFRAVKGAGGPAFGICLNMTFKLFPVPDQVITFGGVYELGEDSAKLYGDFMNLFSSTKEIGAYLKLMNVNIDSGKPYSQIDAFCFGKDSNCEKKILDNLSSGCIKISEDACKTNVFLKFYDYLKPSESLRGGTGMYLYGSYASENNIREAALASTEFVKSNRNMICSLHGVLGGESKNLDPKQELTSVASAMRENIVSITCLALLFEDKTTEQQQKRIKLLQDFGDNTLKKYSKYVYWNEPTHEYPQNDWKERYWGSLDNYQRMLKEKIKVDPLNYFTCYHCIGYEEANSGKEPTICPSLDCSCNNNELGVCSKVNNLVNSVKKLGVSLVTILVFLFY
jgi:hypothetical protein